MNLKEIPNEVTTEMWTIIGLIVTSFGTWLKTKWSVTKKKDNELKIAIDEQQSIQIIHNEALTKSLEESMKAMKASIEALSAVVNEFAEDKRQQRKVEVLKAKIRDIGYNQIATFSPPADLESMILEGCEKAGELFGSILKGGVRNLDVQKLKMVAKQQLRSIRTQYTGEHGMDSDLAEAIKLKVAYPQIQALMGKLQNLQSGVYNGKTDEVFESTALDFVEHFIQSSIIIVNQHK